MTTDALPGEGHEGSRETPLVSFAIQTCPARAELAAALLAEIGVGELAVDPDPPPPGTPPTSALWNPWRCYRHAIETTPPDADYRVVVQDDALVCAGFAAAATAAIAARPNRLVTFYVGGNAKLLAARVTHAAARGHAWVNLPHFSWFPAVAVAWPRRLLDELPAWVDRQPWPKTFRSDDEIIGRFLRNVGEIPLATVPSLVDHPDDVPSLIGTKARGGTDRGRIAACWIGDCDASAVDWAE